MTQEFKSIEEIEEEVAIDYGFSIWDSLFESYAMYDYGMLEKAINEVARRYAQQFQDESETFQKGFVALQEAVLKSAERNKELVEMLEQVRFLVDWSDSSWSNGLGIKLKEEITELITKHKQS